ncbi:MAG: glycosyltransferase [Bacteroidota bacterium]
MKEQSLNFIYWFAYYNLDSPSVRYRAQFPLEFFKKKYGINSYLIIPGYSLIRIIKFVTAYFSALFMLKKDSIIVIQRVNSNFVFSNLLKLLVKIRKKDMVYDLDDADYLEYNPKTIYYFAKRCKVISAGSKKIAEHLSQFNTSIVHTTSPIVDLNIVKKKRNELFTVGWIGGFGGEHKDSIIKYVFPALREISFNFRLILLGVINDSDSKFITNYFSTTKNMEVVIPRNINWHNELDIQNCIVKFDVGIATLLDTEIQRSKSGIKAKQYMNNGIPVVSTDLPENDSVIIDGENGFFCTNSLDFKNRITEFYEMSEREYNGFSANARYSIKNFNHDRYLLDLVKIKNKM